MSKVYVVLTKSATPISILINMATRDEYTHASIAFSDDIKPMYSIGRKYTFLPFPAGMKEEPLDSGFYKYYNNAKLAIYSIEVSESGLKKIKEYVDECYNRKEEITFSYLGVFLNLFNIGLNRKDRYFCSQFVADALNKSEEINTKKPSNVFHPIDFLQIENIQLEFVGKIKDKA